MVAPPMGKIRRRGLRRAMLLSDGRTLGVPLAWFPRLLRGSAECNTEDQATDTRTRATSPLGSEVAGDVEDEIGRSVGEGVDQAIVGLNDRHVRGDSTIIGVQRRDIGL